MQVKLAKEFKKIYTIEQFYIAKRVIAWEKENDDMTVKDWAEYAVREALKDKNDYLDTVILAEAEAARNCRVWDAYFEGSQDFDVWIRATAKTYQGFIEVSAYLSDIWETGATPYVNHMYIQYYKKVD